MICLSLFTKYQRMKSYYLTYLFILIGVLFLHQPAFAQPCTTLGQTPATAFPVCGTSVFTQTIVPLCNTNPLFVPGCSNQPNAAPYENRNPFFYRFACFFLFANMMTAFSTQMVGDKGLAKAAQSLEDGFSFFAAIAIGPGKYSLDYKLKWIRNKW